MAIYISQLKTALYPMAEPSVWLYGNPDGVDKVLQGRLAYVAKKYNDKTRIAEGVRDSEVQASYYNEYLQYKKTRKLGPRGIKLAAKPGTSLHEFSLAVDVGARTKLYSLSNAELRKWGLCKPLENRGEHWHIQPVETEYLTSAQAKRLAPLNLSSIMKSKYALTDDTVAYLDKYKYAEVFYRTMLYNTRREFSKETMDYMRRYSYGEALIRRLGIKEVQ